MAKIVRETQDNGGLTTSREPTVRGPGKPGSVGDTALRDALVALVIGWTLLFALAFSLRKHNV